MTSRAVDLPDRRDIAGLGRQGLVGRDLTMARLADQLEGTVGTLALTSAGSTLTVHGGGGIGKTALALEYCHSLAPGAGYELIWWVNADSDNTTADSFISLISELGGDAEAINIRHEVDRLLAGSGRWLAVFDNVDSREAFDQWRPDAQGGSIIVTTRSSAKWETDQAIAVGLIDPADARQWLIEAEIEELQADPLVVDELVEELGGLALALTMAAAFIHNTPVSLAEYLRLFQQSPVQLLADDQVYVGNYDKTVYTALAVTREQLRARDQDAALLMLEYASFFAPDDIPMFLFTPEGLGVNSEVEVLQARRALQERSLITPAGSDAFNVHRLVQSVTRHHLDNPLPEAQPDKAATKEPRQRTRAAAHTNLPTPSLRRVVVVAANSTQAPLNLGEELRNIQEVLEHSTDLEVTLCPSARTDDLVKHVPIGSTAVVHFCGHGEKAGIYLKEDDGEADRLVPGQRLEQFFQGRGVDLVVLNSCYSAEQAPAIARATRTVIGTPEALTDEAGYRFSRAFYRTLARGGTVAEALTDGQVTVSLRDLDDSYESHGQLDYQLVDAPQQARPTPPQPKPVPSETRAASTQGSSSAPNPTPAAASRQSRLERAYFVAGIVVAVVAVASLVVALWPQGSGESPTTPSGPTTSVPPAD